MAVSGYGQDFPLGGKGQVPDTWDGDSGFIHRQVVVQGTIRRHLPEVNLVVLQASRSQDLPFGRKGDRESRTRTRQLAPFAARGEVPKPNGGVSTGGSQGLA